MDDTIVTTTIGVGPSAGNAPPPPWQRAARVLLGVAFVLLGLFVLQNFLRALAWAGVLAVATWPLYAKLQQRFPPGRHNILLPGLFTLVTTLVVLVPLIIVAYHAAAEARNVATWLHDAREHGIPLPSALAGLPLAEPRVSGWWAANLASPEGAQAWLGRADQELMSFGRAYGGRIAHSIVNFCFTLLALFFLYRDGPALSQQLLGAANTLFGPAGERVGRQMIASIHGTVDGLVLVGLGVGLLLGIAYAIAGVPHAILMGTLTAGAAMVPLASWLVLLLGCLLVLVAGNTIAAIALAAFGIVVIFSADHFVRPSLIGSATRLPFIWVLLGILGGVETFGLLGLFLGPAVMAALILLWREWVGDAKTQSSAKP